MAGAYEVMGNSDRWSQKHSMAGAYEVMGNSDRWSQKHSMAGAYEVMGNSDRWSQKVQTYFSASSLESQRSSTVHLITSPHPLVPPLRRSSASETHASIWTLSSMSISLPCAQVYQPCRKYQNVAAPSSNPAEGPPCLMPPQSQLPLHHWKVYKKTIVLWIREIIQYW